MNTNRERLYGRTVYIFKAIPGQERNTLFGNAAIRGVPAPYILEVTREQSKRHELLGVENPPAVVSKSQAYLWL